MVDFPKFFATVAELYSLWPAFFNWAAGLIIPVLGAIIAATWWMRGFKADAKEAALEGQIAILQQRLALATEQQKSVTEQVEKLKQEVAQLKAAVPKGEALKDFQISTSHLEGFLDSVVTSNNAVGTTLTLVLPGYPNDPPVVIPRKR